MHSNMARMLEPLLASCIHRAAAVRPAAASCLSSSPITPSSWSVAASLTTFPGSRPTSHTTATSSLPCSLPSSLSSSSTLHLHHSRHISTSSSLHSSQASPEAVSAVRSIPVHDFGLIPPTSPTGALTVHYPQAIEYLTDREAWVYDLARQPVSVTSLNGAVFNVPVRLDILQRAVRYLRAKWQQGTHASKNKAEVSGGGRKPWAQKGSGKARQGSIRSPLWVGGGAAHGPRPRSHAHKLYRNVRMLAVKCALSAKINEGRLVIVDSLQPASHKTSAMSATLRALLSGTPGSSVLLVDTGLTGGDGGEVLRKAVGSLPWAEVMAVEDLTVYHLLKYHILVLSLPAAKLIEAMLAAPVRRQSALRMAWYAQQQAAFKVAAEELAAEE
ncbi:MAG: hypothetical protein WDW38_004264 [Sanguina aurantia]